MRRASRYALVLLALLVVAPAAYRAADRLRFSSGRTRLLVVGIDGADWRTIDPLLQRGELPHLAALLERGVRADLRVGSVALSPTAWTTLLSGQPPEVHGVVVAQAQASDVRVQRLWDLAEGAGWSVGIFGFPPTWPPRPVRGFLVPDYLARGPETHPAELEFLKRMETTARSGGTMGVAEQVGYALRGFAWGLRPTTLARSLAYVVASRVHEPSWLERYAALRALQYRIHTDAFAYLRERNQPDLAAFYSDVVDKTSHVFFAYHEPAAFSGLDPAEIERFGETVRDAYRWADASLGRLLDGLPDDAAVAVLSDHGFEAAGGARHVHFGLIAPALLRWLGSGGDAEAVKVSDAFAVRPRDATARARVQARLSAVRHGRSGAPLFALEASHDGTLLLSWNEALELRAGDEIRFEDRATTLERISEVEARSGTHRNVGIFVLACGACRRGESVGEIAALDVLPTLLRVMSIEAPEALPGRPVGAVFR